MAHPYASKKEKHPGKARVHKLYGYARGGSVHSDEAEDKKLIKKLLAEHEREEMKVKGTMKHDMSASGHKSKSRMDKYARGGKVRHKGSKTHINIVVAPHKDAAAAGGLPPAPPMAGPPPMPPMPPGAPMGPPPGGPMGGGGPPGLGMKRGGKVMSGIANPENLKKWSNYASSNTRYERGGKVPMKGGGDTGIGRLDKIKAYGKNARKK